VLDGSDTQHLSHTSNKTRTATCKTLANMAYFVNGYCYSGMRCNGNQWEWTWCTLFMGTATVE